MDNPTCEFCGGETNYIGTLGTLDWFRCADCGHEQYVEHDPAIDLLEKAERGGWNDFYN